MASLETPQPDVHFTVFIRLPFPRGDFVDPPPVHWNAAKDRALWDILSRPSAKGDDIDWKALAESFDVTLPFLLQQAAWLYDRQLSQVRAQMRRVGTAHSTSPSPAPAPGSMSGSAALAGQGAKRTPSAGTRVPPKLSTQQKDPGLLRGEPSPATSVAPLRPKVPAHARTTSTATVTQVRAPREPSPPRPAPTAAAPRELRRESVERRHSVNRREQAAAAAVAPLRASPALQEEEGSISSSSEESSDEDVPGRRAPGFKRFGKFSTHRPGLRDDEDEEDESPAFLPLIQEAEPPPHEQERHDLNATLRVDTEHPGVQRQRTTEHVPLCKQVTATSSTSSASSGFVGVQQTEAARRANQAAGMLSPQRAAEASHLSPRRRAANGKETSDDTPSMGSSFSDLDDASVTQSALEEALLSNMQHGGMASRMSTISQALRSRYF